MDGEETTTRVRRRHLSVISGELLALVIPVVSRSPARNWIAWALAVPAFLHSLFPTLGVLHLKNPAGLVLVGRGASLFLRRRTSR